jgi:hypothetical protein
VYIALLLPSCARRVGLHSTILSSSLLVPGLHCCADSWRRSASSPVSAVPSFAHLQGPVRPIPVTTTIHIDGSQVHCSRHHRRPPCPGPRRPQIHRRAPLLGVCRSFALRAPSAHLSAALQLWRRCCCLRPSMRPPPFWCSKSPPPGSPPNHAPNRTPPQCARRPAGLPVPSRQQGPKTWRAKQRSKGELDPPPPACCASRIGAHAAEAQPACSPPA